MIETETNEIQFGGAPTPEDDFYYQWGQETLKQNFILSNSILSSIVTLSSVMLGGSILLANDAIFPESFKLIIALLFLLALIVSFFGIMPEESEVNLNVPQEIKEHKEKTLKAKRRYIWISGMCMIAAFIIAFTGIFIKLFR
ncbi:MAG: hypothetical protein ILNGONEN_00787 [Syntrophorhabdaceae bacterium]|nr:hypothetical protein [Syntrophorhabdaceae bacterium]